MENRNYGNMQCSDLRRGNGWWEHSEDGGKGLVLMSYRSMLQETYVVLFSVKLQSVLQLSQLRLQTAHLTLLLRQPAKQNSLWFLKVFTILGINVLNLREWHHFTYAARNSGLGVAEMDCCVNMTEMKTKYLLIAVMFGL